MARGDQIKFWIINWGSKAEVLEPESLRNEVIEEAEKTLRQYSKITRSKAKQYMLKYYQLVRIFFDCLNL